LLVFDGGYLFSGINTQPPSKTSIRARFRWRLLVFRHQHPTTIENEHLSSLLVVVTCFPASAPHHHRKRARLLAFDGAILFLKYII